MFTDILDENELKRIYKMYKAEGISATKSIIGNIVAELSQQYYLLEEGLNLDTTVLNAFKLIKQLKKIQKGYSQILYFYKWLNEKFRRLEAIEFSNEVLAIGEYLAEAIRKIKERITAVIQVYAGISALVIAIIAIIISIVLSFLL